MQFLQAIRARCQVRWNQDEGFGMMGTFTDLEVLEVGRWQQFLLHVIDDCECRTGGDEVPQKGEVVRFGTLNLDRDAVGGIAHIAAQPMRSGQLVNPGPEADALHNALNQ